MIMPWWETLTRRERLVIIAGISFIFVTVIFLVLAPVVQERQRMIAEIPRLREDLAWMKAHLNEAWQLGNAGLSAQNDTSKALTPAIVENALRRNGLLEKVAELRPAEKQGIMISFDKVEYAKLMKWLFDLNKQNGAEVAKASIIQLPEKRGMVKASLTLIGIAVGAPPGRE